MDTLQDLAAPRDHRANTRWFEWGLLSALLLACVVALSAARSFEHIDLALTDQLSRLSTQPI